jgi:hypothetical protein
MFCSETEPKIAFTAARVSSRYKKMLMKQLTLYLFLWDLPQVSDRSRRKICSLRRKVQILSRKVLIGFSIKGQPKPLRESSCIPSACCGKSSCSILVTVEVDAEQSSRPMWEVAVYFTPSLIFLDDDNNARFSTHSIERAVFQSFNVKQAGEEKSSRFEDLGKSACVYYYGQALYTFYVDTSYCWNHWLSETPKPTTPRRRAPRRCRTYQAMCIYRGPTSHLVRLIIILNALDSTAQSHFQHVLMLAST